ncbi:hypothetical protein PQR62_04275 [Herbaspirillum lusitanum]|uniref:Uncharacterized protein n=1 Tax=Herbaspirillum lusitanum TaxID=213312 RepID=A0ABW9A4W4_9BURK
MTIFLTLLTVVLILWAVPRSLLKQCVPSWGKRKYSPASSSSQELEGFFGDRSNYADQPMEKLFARIGCPAQHDDWDWGRRVYLWESPAMRVRVIERGGKVICAQLLDPAGGERFESPLQTLWGNPDPVNV